MPQSKALSLLVTHAWGKNWLFTSKGQLINTWLTQANTLCSTSLWEFTTEPEQKSSWVHVVKAITNNYCGRGDWEAGRVMAGYKTLIQIRWVQTLQRKLLFWEQPLHKTIVWILPCLERQEPALPTKTIGNAEKQSILTPASSFWEKNTSNSTLGRHRQVKPVKPLIRLPQLLPLCFHHPLQTRKGEWKELSFIDNLLELAQRVLTSKKISSQ